MRLAIYHSLPSGGAKRALFETARRLAHDHTLSVYSLSTAEHDFCDLRPFASSHRLYEFRPLPLFRSPLGRLNQLQRWRDLYRLRRLEQQIAADIDQAGDDVVFVQPSAWTQAPLLLPYLHAPSIYYLHEPLRLLYEPEVPRPGQSRRPAWLDRLDPLIPLYRRALGRLDRLGTRQATRRLANSRFTADNVLRAYGCSAEVCYLGVDAEAFQPRPNVLKTDSVLSVGALRPNKGFDFLVQALSLIPAASRPRLVLVTNMDDPAERAYLQRLAQAQQVGLTIEVMVDHERLVQRYCEASAFVYAPVREPFGLAPLEAMACGTPVVAVAEGGVRETVEDGQTGRLVPRAAEKFAAALHELLSNPRQQAAYGQQGRLAVEERWTWDLAVARLTQHLELARRRSPEPRPA